MQTISIIRPKRRARRALLMQYFLMGLIFSTMLSRFPGLRTYYNISVSELSFVLFCMSIGSLCIMPFCSYLVGRFGSKKMTLAGFVYMAMFPFLALMPNIFVLYFFGALYGVFVSLTDVSVNGNSIIVENAYKRPIISMFHALFYVGVFSGAILSLFFITFEISVFLHFFLIALFSIITFSYIRRFFLKETIRCVPVKKRGVTFLFPKGNLLLIAFIALFGRIVEGSISDWSTVYMKMVVDFPENLAPIGLAIYSAFMSLGRFMGDSVRAHYRDSLILIYCCLFATIGVFIMIINTTPIYAFTGLFIAGVGISCLVPIIYGLAGKQRGVTPAVGIAMVNTISGTGFLFGPFVIGIVADMYGMRASFVYILLLALIMTILVGIFRKYEKSRC